LNLTNSMTGENLPHGPKAATDLSPLRVAFNPHTTFPRHGKSRVAMRGVRRHRPAKNRRRPELVERRASAAKMRMNRPPCGSLCDCWCYPVPSPPSTSGRREMFGATSASKSKILSLAIIRAKQVDWFRPGEELTLGAMRRSGVRGVTICCTTSLKRLREPKD
jgi:hypothetical protein